MSRFSQSFNHLGHLIQDLIDRNTALEDENCRLQHELSLLKASFHTDESGNNSLPATEEEEVGLAKDFRMSRSR